VPEEQFGRVLDGADELADESRLADSGGAEDREQVAGAAGDRARVCVPQHGQLARASHERRVEPTFERDFADDAAEPPRRHSGPLPF
jgi:hypothetical protein